MGKRSKIILASLDNLSNFVVDSKQLSHVQDKLSIKLLELIGREWTDPGPDKTLPIKINAPNREPPKIDRI